MMERWECRTCSGNVDEGILYDADRANKLIPSLEACYRAAQELVMEFGLSNPFPNLAAAVKAVQEVKREMRLS